MAEQDHIEELGDKIKKVSDENKNTVTTPDEDIQDYTLEEKSAEDPETNEVDPEEEEIAEETPPDQLETTDTPASNETDKDEKMTTELYTGDQSEILDSQASDGTDENMATDLNDDESEGLLFGEDLDSQSRNLLFEKGVQFKRKGDHPRALHCFLSCLKGLDPGCQFTHLPECLHNVAEIYSSEGDYENAIQFIQAEKIYYETALIEVGGEEETVTKEWESFGGNLPTDHGEDKSLIKVIDPDATNPEAIRANEYEKLGIMCLRQKNVQLALEYCGKATKIRQTVYGENHAVTVKSLDLFTAVYAEMGKVQYSAAMERFGQVQKKIQDEKKEDSEKKEVQENTENSKAKEEETLREETVEELGATESSDPGLQETQTETTFTLTRGQAFFIYFVVSIAVMLLAVVFCSYWIGKDIPWTYRYMSRRLKFYYYYYLQNPFSKDKYF